MIVPDRTVSVRDFYFLIGFGCQKVPCCAKVF